MQFTNESQLMSFEGVTPQPQFFWSPSIKVNAPAFPLLLKYPGAAPAPFTQVSQ